MPVLFGTILRLDSLIGGVKKGKNRKKVRSLKKLFFAMFGPSLNPIKGVWSKVWAPDVNGE